MLEHASFLEAPVFRMSDSPHQSERRYLRRLLPLGFALALIAAAVFLPLSEWAGALEAWNRGHPVGGAAVFVFGSVLAAALFVPGSIIAMLAGYLFGFVSGAVLALVALTLGAWVALLAGRFLVRDWAKSKIDGSRTLAALDHAVGQKGILVVALVRASLVVPYNLLNYVLGATGIRAVPYIIGTCLGMIPPSLLYAYLGTLARSIEDIQSGRLDAELPGAPIIVVGVVVVVTAVLVIQRTASRVLREQLET